MSKHTNLIDLVMIHHTDAAAKVAPLLKQRKCGGVSMIAELVKEGNKFTTRVEKRLRKLEVGF